MFTTLNRNPNRHESKDEKAQADLIVPKTSEQHAYHALAHLQCLSSDITHGDQKETYFDGSFRKAHRKKCQISGLSSIQITDSTVLELYGAILSHHTLFKTNINTLKNFLIFLNENTRLPDNILNAFSNLVTKFNEMGHDFSSKKLTNLDNVNLIKRRIKILNELYKELFISVIEWFKTIKQNQDNNYQIMKEHFLQIKNRLDSINKLADNILNPANENFTIRMKTHLKKCDISFDEKQHSKETIEQCLITKLTDEQFEDFIQNTTLIFQKQAGATISHEPQRKMDQRLFSPHKNMAEKNYRTIQTKPASTFQLTRQVLPQTAPTPTPAQTLTLSPWG